MSIVQVLVCGLPVAATCGVKVTDSVCDDPRLSKYSTVTGCAVPAAPAAVSVAGRLAFRSIIEVGWTATWLWLICTGASPAELSRGCAGIVPSGFAAQPITARPEEVTR